MYISPSPSLGFKELFCSNKNKNFHPLAVRDQNSYFFLRGCGALCQLLQILERGGDSMGRTALVPSYLCQDVIKTFQLARVPIQFYGIDETCQFDSLEIEEKLDRQVKILYVVHYFGFPQSVDSIVRFAQEKNVVVVEDCAHSLFGKYGETWLGEFGDVAIFSLRKTLPVPDGGGLLVNHQIIPNLKIDDVSAGISSIFGIMKLIFKRLLWQFQCPPWSLPFIGRRLMFPGSSQNQVKHVVSGISKISRKIFGRCDVEKISLTRRKNFLFYLEAIGRVPGVSALFHDLPIGVVPYSFPILVSNRDQLVREMKKKGVSLNMGFPEAGDIKWDDTRLEREYPGTDFLAHHLLELPVHQDLDEKHLQKIVDLLSIMTQKNDS